MKKEILMFIVLIIFVSILFGFGIWFIIAQWNECIEMGFSKFYCWKHIS